MSSSTDKNGNVNSSSSNKHSLLDRTIPIVLPVADLDNKDTTPSRKQGVSVQVERLHRLQGTSLISMGIHILQQPSGTSTEEATATTSPISYSPTSWYASACTIFHRYYHGVSLLQRDVWSVAMASTLIAAKLEEIPLTVRQLIIVYAHLYTRRRHVVMSTRDNDDDNNAMSMLFQKIINHPEVLVANCISESSSRRRTIPNKLASSCVQALLPTGPIWKEWHEALLQTESSILRQLGFVIHWIPNRHVHKFIYAFLHVLQIAPTTTTTARTASDPSAAKNNSNNNSNNHDADDDDRHRLAQGVWNYCNLSYRLDLCCRFEAPVIACTAIYLAALDLGFDVDQDLHVVKSLVSHNTKTTTATAMNHHPWWKILLLGTAAVTDKNAQVEKTATDLIQIANTLAGLAAASAVSTDASKDGHHGSSGSNRLGDDDDDDKLGVDQNQLDVLVASVAFLKPLNQDSFHGPDSFVWEMANRHDAATASATATTATR